MLFAVEQSGGRSLMMSWCVQTAKILAAAPTVEESRGTAYAGMDLQPSAKDCIRLRHGGREGREWSTQGWVENGVK